MTVGSATALKHQKVPSDPKLLCMIGKRRLPKHSQGYLKSYGRSFQHSAVSVQLLHECRQHAFQFGGPLVQCVIVLGLDELQIARQQQVIFQLASRSHSDGTEAGQFSISVASAPLSQISRDGGSGKLAVIW